jgi:hypothetical protein
MEMERGLDINRSAISVTARDVHDTGNSPRSQVKMKRDDIGLDLFPFPRRGLLELTENLVLENHGDLSIHVPNRAVGPDEWLLNWFDQFMNWNWSIATYESLHSNLPTIVLTPIDNCL